jgi:hypothetical protein
VKRHLPGLADPLYGGSVVLGQRIRRWVTRPNGDRRAPLKRLAGLGGVGYVAMASDYTTYAVAGGTAAWVVAAFMHAGSELPPAEGASEHPEPPPEQGPVPDLAGAIRTLAQGGHGAHYEALAEHLAEDTGQAWDTAAVRAACRAAGIPHCGSVRQPGRGVSTGVRLADLPAPSPSPSPAPATAVVVAGQDTTTTPATGPATPGELQPTSREEQGMTIITNPAEHNHYATTKEAHRG